MYTVIINSAPILFWSKMFKHDIDLNTMFQGINMKNRLKYAEKAFKFNGFLLRYIKVSKRSTLLCTIAVKSQPGAIKYVPKNRRSNKLVLMAVRHSAETLKCGTEKQQRKFIATAVLNSNWSYRLWSEQWAIDILNTLEDKGAALKEQWEMQEKKKADDWHMHHAHI